MYGYAIPKSDLPDDMEGHKTKSDLRISQDRAASAYFGMVLIKWTLGDVPGQELVLQVPVCEGTSAEECTYDTSAAVWALLAAKVPEMTFKDMPMYVIRH